MSVLSPYIRRRLVLESDAVSAALAVHGPAEAEKFVQEVIWRGYLKGWLERRPQVWTSYVSGLEADMAALDRDRRLRRDVERAVNGQTGLDKGRGMGGRVAARRIGDLRFDHGAQYVNSRTLRFTAALDNMDAAVADWDDGSGRLRRVGVPGMPAIPKALGSGLDVRQSMQVNALDHDGKAWVLTLDAGAMRADRVVVTVPAPQVAGLLGDGYPLVAGLSAVRFAPCLTLMATVTGPAPFITRQDADDPLAWIAQDSTKPGRSQGADTQWVAQAGEAFSRAHLEETPAEMAARMRPLLCDRLKVTPAQMTHAVAHRWRYARVSEPLGQPFLRSPDATLYLGGDWCIGARVEAAWTSGTAIADDILARDEPCRMTRALPG